MPIRPENKHFYKGPEWTKVRDQILERAGHRCEWCGVPNGIVVIRGTDHAGRDVWQLQMTEIQRSALDGVVTGFGAVNNPRHVPIILTTAHLDHDPANNDQANLRALCQRCHNRYDAMHRAQNRAIRCGHVGRRTRGDDHE